MICAVASVLTTVVAVALVEAFVVVVVTSASPLGDVGASAVVTIDAVVLASVMFLGVGIVVLMSVVIEDETVAALTVVVAVIVLVYANVVVPVLAESEADVGIKLKLVVAVVVASVVSVTLVVVSFSILSVVGTNVSELKLRDVDVAVLEFVKFNADDNAQLEVVAVVNVVVSRAGVEDELSATASVASVVAAVLDGDAMLVSVGIIVVDEKALVAVARVV